MNWYLCRRIRHIRGRIHPGPCPRRRSLGYGGQEGGVDEGRDIADVGDMGDVDEDETENEDVSVGDVDVGSVEGGGAGCGTWLKAWL